MTLWARSVEIALYLAAGCLSANDEGGIIAREAMNIDSVQQEPQLPQRAPVAVLHQRPGPRRSCAGPMLGRLRPPLNRLRGLATYAGKSVPPDNALVNGLARG